FPTCLEGGGLAWTRIESTAEFTAGRHGLREPRADVAETPGRTVELVQIATVLVPVLGLSAAGTRLGQGGGYYDRFLASWRSARPDGSAVGIAFDTQIVDTLPQDPHDEPVDIVITESRTIRCRP
ncbi:MAG: 5-formyltetrahydrofolate cyclo-ligase, partial [Planctomycetota bacterium]